MPKNICKVFARNLDHVEVLLPDRTVVSSTFSRSIHKCTSFRHRDPLTGHYVRREIVFREFEGLDVKRLKFGLPILLRAVEAWIVREILHSMGKEGVICHSEHNVLCLILHILILFLDSRCSL